MPDGDLSAAAQADAGKEQLGQLKQAGQDAASIVGNVVALATSYDNFRNGLAGPTDIALADASFSQRAQQLKTELDNLPPGPKGWVDQMFTDLGYPPAP